MALLQVSFKSKALMMQTSVNVLLPMGTNRVDMENMSDLTYEHKKFPVVYLLHGATDDHSCWLRLSSIERYAEDKGIAVVMPNADLSCYSDMIHGHKYWTYISEELPNFIEAAFPISSKREDNFAAGLSMGGYGAFKLGLRKPEKFAAVASLSGLLDLVSSLNEPGPSFFENVFGDSATVPKSRNDLVYGLEQLKKENKRIPKLFQACGREDFLYQNNLTFRDFANSLGVDLNYEEGPGGHEWSYWDTNIQRVLDWLPLESNKIVK
ncbi:alpha/beta hydrolase [Metabacillus halosaccharovorans]|uniref:alpha/beta hydrolase n=1 Tax=Metabacillus halosaccharovorans TaxID=930124 RepID=UPI001C200C51|nr:alpha/beta hydrolase family protein [Metabacillus halosaccharovorans]MBU7591218.1 esterase family protein [Metabacillus halosaccharovorans]